MNIDMKQLQVAILIPFSLDQYNPIYYYSKGNGVLPYRKSGDGNLFYHKSKLSDYCPKYDINCLYESNSSN